MEVTVETAVSPDDEKIIVELYRASIDSLETLAAGIQAFSDDEFRAQLGNEKILKLVGRGRSGHPQALCLLATELSAVPWINPAFYAKRFPDYFERRRIFYIGTVVVKPDRQAGGWAQLLMKEVARVVGAEGGVAAFDCCEFNRGLIPELALKMALKYSTRVEPLQVDAQRFYAYELSDFQPAGDAAVHQEIDLRTARAPEEVDIDLVALEAAERDAVTERGGRE